MSDIGKDTIQILQYLLPGFLSAWIFYGLTPFAKPSEFERVIQALIFTLIIQTIVFLESLWLVDWLHFWTQERWATSAQVAAPALTALIVGLVFAAGANNDMFHAVARRLRVTKETSYPSQWYSALATNEAYVVLQLTDERRLYGWPTEWPSDPREGQFLLQDASWLAKDGEEPLTGVASIMIDVKDVKWVEIMADKWETRA